MTPALLVYVDHRHGSALVQGTGAGVLLAEVHGRSHRSRVGGGYLLLAQGVPELVAAARARGGTATVAHVDGSACECAPPRGST